MSKSRPKTMHYKKVASNDAAFNYQTMVSDVLTKLSTITKRTIVRGEKTIQCLKLKRSTSHGIYIHLTSFVEGEQATTVKKSQDPDLNVASAPDGEEFVDGDIHALISNNDLLFCVSASKETTIKEYFDALFEKASIERPEYVFQTPIRKQILSMLAAGVKKIDLNAHATPLELDKLKKSTSKYLEPLKKIASALVLREKSLEEIDSLDGLMFGVHINSKGRINPDSDAQAVIQKAGQDILEEGLGGFVITMRDGSTVTQDSISYKHKKQLAKYGKTVFRQDAWDALAEFRDKLVKQNVIK